MAEYFVDSSAGNDSNDGLSEANAWQTLSKVRSTTFSSGDIIRFKRGQTFRGLLDAKHSGASGNLIVYADYGTGALPIITAYDLVTGWTQAGDEFYASLSTAPTLVWNDHASLSLGSGVGLLNVGEYFYDAGNSRLYVRTGVDPSGSAIEVANSTMTTASVRVNGKSYNRFENLRAKALFNGVASTGRCFLLENGSNNEVLNCEADSDKNGGSIGILNFRHPSPKITGTIIHNVEDGILLNANTSAGYAGEIRKCVLYDIDRGTASTQDAVKIQDNEDFTGFVIAQNDISGFGQDGIDAFSGKNLIIEDNLIHDSNTLQSGGTVVGIKTDGTGSGTIVRRNKIVGMGLGVSGGVSITVGDGVRCHENICLDPEIEGIRVTGDNALVHDNIVRDAAQAIRVSEGTGSIVRDNVLDGSKTGKARGPEDLKIETGVVASGGGNFLVNDAAAVNNGTYTGVDVGQTDPMFPDPLKGLTSIRVGSSKRDGLTLGSLSTATCTGP